MAGSHRHLMKFGRPHTVATGMAGIPKNAEQHTERGEIPFVLDLGSVRKPQECGAGAAAESADRKKGVITLNIEFSLGAGTHSQSGSIESPDGGGLRQRSRGQWQLGVSRSWGTFSAKITL